MRRQRERVALRGRADLHEHGRARAGRDDGLEQRPALVGRVEVELARRAGHHEAVHAGVDQAAREGRGGGEVDALAVVVEREQGGVHPRRRHWHGAQDTVGA